MFFKKKRVKNKDGTERVYLQWVESRRVKGKPRQIVVANLGRIDTDVGRRNVEKMTGGLIAESEVYSLLNEVKDIETKKGKSYGSFLVFKRLWEEMRFEEVFEEELKNIGARFNAKEAIFNMVLNRLSHPRSKRRLLTWQKKLVYGVQSFDLHQYYRAMDYLIILTP